MIHLIVAFKLLRPNIDKYKSEIKLQVDNFNQLALNYFKDRLLYAGKDKEVRKVLLELEGNSRDSNPEFSKELKKELDSKVHRTQAFFKKFIPRKEFKDGFDTKIVAKNVNKNDALNKMMRKQVGGANEGIEDKRRIREIQRPKKPNMGPRII